MIKILFLLLASVAGIVHLNGQTVEALKVKYEAVFHFDADMIIDNVPAVYRSQLEDVLREEIDNGIYLEYELRTNGSKSVFELQRKPNNAQGMAGIILEQITSQDSGKLIKDLDSLLYYKEYTIVDKTYMVKNDLNDFSWEILKNKDTIAGHSVRKARGVMNDSVFVDAWFTTKIPIKDGPERMAGLPGLILKIFMEVNNNKISFTATEIAIMDGELKIGKIKPSKTYTEEEFREEVRKLQKKIREMQGGGVDKND